jgi:hypothetical protein
VIAPKRKLYVNGGSTKHITNALMQIRVEKLKREASIPKKLELG